MSFFGNKEAKPKKNPSFPHHVPAYWLQIGKSKWKKILEAGEGIFQNRSQVDLKDKWRNLERQGIVAPVAPRLSDGQSPATLAAPGPQSVQMGPVPGAPGQPGGPAMGGDGLQQGPLQAHPQQSHQHMGQHMMQVSPSVHPCPLVSEEVQ